MYTVSILLKLIANAQCIQHQALEFKPVQVLKKCLVSKGQVYY